MSHPRTPALSNSSRALRLRPSPGMRPPFVGRFGFMTVDAHLVDGLPASAEWRCPTTVGVDWAAPAIISIAMRSRTAEHAWALAGDQKQPCRHEPRSAVLRGPRGGTCDRRDSRGDAYGDRRRSRRPIELFPCRQHTSLHGKKLLISDLGKGKRHAEGRLWLTIHYTQANLSLVGVCVKRIGNQSRIKTGSALLNASARALACSQGDHYI